MLDTLEVVKQLAELTAADTHRNTVKSQNAMAIKGTGTSAATLQTKYDPVIA